MTDALTPVPVDTAGILDRLAALRAQDAPTHGGHVLSYVYDPGLAELDDLAADAMRAVQPVNGLDPTTFTSIAVMEREVVAFARAMLHGGSDVVGSVTSGGTESCLLAVKTARDHFLATRPAPSGTTTGAAGPARSGRPRVVAPVSVHAAFRKAAAYFGVDLTLVPVDPATGRAPAAAIVAELDDDVALVVVSAPSYPHGVIDQVADVAAAASARGILVHVDACIGGWVLPFWAAAGGEPVPVFDFAVPGVTSVSADVHKYGYSPKGASVLLVRGRDLQRYQFFGTTTWPGYPVVNPTMAGSKSAAPLAAAWAVSQALGTAGYTALTARCVTAAGVLRAVIEDIRGLRLVGDAQGPLIAVAADEAVPEAHRVDPHVWADEVRSLGWVIQAQPGMTQADGTALAHTAHLTVTPVTASVVTDLGAALRAGADKARGVPRPDAGPVLAELAGLAGAGAGLAGAGAGAGLAGTGDLPAVLGALAALDADGRWDLLQKVLQGPALPERIAPLLALVEALPAQVAEPLLIELLARVADPDVAG